MIQASQDQLEIRNLIESWAVWRDAGDWERLREAWHEGGVMHTTVLVGTRDEFVARARASFDKGFEVIHSLGGMSIDVQGDRAIAQTKMSINQRGEIDGIKCDCICLGRFYDFLERRDGRWGISIRQPIYEMDRLFPLDSSAQLDLDQQKLASFPAGYRHLAYLQWKMGFNIKQDLPETRGAVVETLYAEGKKWLEGADKG